jgi:hypothetical protein
VFCVWPCRAKKRTVSEAESAQDEKKKLRGHELSAHTLGPLPRHSRVRGEIGRHERIGRDAINQNANEALGPQPMLFQRVLENFLRFARYSQHAPNTQRPRTQLGSKSHDPQATVAEE